MNYGLPKWHRHVELLKFRIKCAPASSRVCVDVQGSCCHQGLCTCLGPGSIPGTTLVFKGPAAAGEWPALPTRAMVTAGSGLLPRTMSGSVVMLQPPSVLMSISAVIVKGSEAKSTRVGTTPHQLQYSGEQAPPLTRGSTPESRLDTLLAVVWVISPWWCERERASPTIFLLLGDVGKGEMALLPTTPGSYHL